MFYVSIEEGSSAIQLNVCSGSALHASTAASGGRDVKLLV